MDHNASKIGSQESAIVIILRKDMVLTKFVNYFEIREMSGEFDPVLVPSEKLEKASKNSTSNEVPLGKSKLKLKKECKDGKYKS